MTPEQLIKVYEAMLDIHHRRIIELQIQSESEEVYSHSYGTTVMTNQDRMMNRLVGSLVYAHMDVPPHDDEALRWIEKVLNGPVF